MAEIAIPIQISHSHNKQSKYYQTHGMKARKLGHNYVNVEHLFLSIFRDPTNIAAKVLQEMGLKAQNLKGIIFEHWVSE